MKPLVIIPARGGSKGVPGKNIKDLCGKPLIQYTIEAAREVFSDDIICVSTDDKSIKQIVEDLNLEVPFLRPRELATDTTGSYEVLLHAIEYYESIGYFPDTIVLLQPTSPFRRGSHIREAMAIFDNNCEMVVSVKVSKSNPYYVLHEENKLGWLEKSKKGNYTRRQDCPIAYEYNGAIYLIHTNILKKFFFNEFTKIRKFLMDEKSSHDIDTLFDWEIAQLICNNS